LRLKRSGKSAIPPLKDAGERKRAFTSLCERFKHRTRAEDAPDDLELAMQGQPTVTPGLKEAPGGIPAVLTALRAFDNPDAQAFMTFYDSLTITEQRHLKLEEIAVAADVGSRHLLGLAAEALCAYGTAVNQILIWAGMPKITKRILKNAMTEKGAFAQEMVWKASGVLPVPKGAQIALQQINQLPPAEEPKQLKPWNQESHLREIAEAMGDRGALPTGIRPPHEPLPDALNTMQERTVEVLEGQ